MRLNDEQFGFLRSQEDLTSYAGKKTQLSHEDVASLTGDNGDYAPIESPATTGPHYLMLTKQNSFEHEHDHDESLGILTPDQMTDFTVALESSRTPSCENLSANSNKFLNSKSSEVIAEAARHLDLAIRVSPVDVLSSTIPDRSPSLEELPLDPKPVVIIAEDVEQLKASLSEKKPATSSALQTEQLTKALTVDSTETSEHTSDQTTRSTSVGGGHVLPTSFVTSVTSITSLEAGYQGDGENSRPASRGPEPLSVAPVTNLLVSKTCRQDPMTDSDFFTESDADAHEEIVRGDRRAQVIDGTLFCANPHERRCLSFEPEEMDSSGIYSDLEKRQDGVTGDVDPEGYGDGDHTTDTGDTEISLKSQLSNRDQPAVPLVTQNVSSPPDVLNEMIESNSTTSTAEVTVIKCQKNEQNTATKSKSSSMSNKENSAPLKKYKMPKRNVISKIKTMIEANNAKEETESEPKRPQRQQRKNGRWEAVMSKIEAGKQRSRPQKKEIKSRVLDGLTTAPAGTAKRERRARVRPDTSNSPNQETARSSVRSSASDLSNALSKEILKRPTRKNGEQSPKQQQQQSPIIVNNHHSNHHHHHQLNATLNSKSNHLGQVRKNQAGLKSQAQTNAAKQKNNSSAPPSSKVAEQRNNRTAPHQQQQQQQQQPPSNNANESNILNHHINNHFYNNNHHNNNNVRKTLVPVSELEVVDHVGPAARLLPIVDTREQECQVDLCMDESPGPEIEPEPEPEPEVLKVDKAELLSLRDKANTSIQALALTVQYFKNQIDSASTKNASLRLQKTSLEDELAREREERRVYLESLQNELSEANQKKTILEEKLETERCRSEKLEKSWAEQERLHQEALTRLAAEHEAELAQARAQQVVPREQAGLYAEIESLRTVLELRSQEYASLRSEADLLRREMDDKEIIKHKYESLQARCEDLQAQLQSKEDTERKLLHEHEVLVGSIHQMSKQTKRLNQKNEELYWRLRHKNETLSVMRYQLTPHQPTNRLSKSLDTENADPYQHHDQSSSVMDSSNGSQKSEAYESPSCSMIKYMIEKSDSVSWTLDITDDFDGSNCSATSAAKNGVKRQNSLRLSNQRRTLTPNRSRSSSIAAPASNSSCESVRAAAAAAAAAIRTPKKEPTWSPTFNSTPNPSKPVGQRRRTIADAGEPSWSLTNNIMENTSCSGSGNIVCSANSSKVMAALEVLTDEDEEEAVGQRPQEAGGEAMISEETSASSSSEEDDSSVSIGDIP